MNGLLAKHDDHEGDSKGEDPVDKDQKLGVRETAGMAHRINVVLEGGAAAFISSIIRPLG